jgi:hypothetical protein
MGLAGFLRDRLIGDEDGPAKDPGEDDAPTVPKRHQPEVPA